jgi:hypothetical protein
MAELSDAEIAEELRQSLKALHGMRNSASAHIAASLEMIERSRELIQQIDRIERQMLGALKRRDRGATSRPGRISGFAAFSSFEVCAGVSIPAIASPSAWRQQQGQRQPSR